MNKTIIKSNFDRYADMYDEHSDIQRFCANKLLEDLDELNPVNILDVGCGTGWYTGRLSECFVSSNIDALDIAPNMIAYAKDLYGYDNIEFHVADVETYDFDKTYDLITSNASLQWLVDLPLALAKFNDLLNDAGVFLVSVFGPQTFKELHSSLVKFLGQDALISANQFVAEDVLKGFIQDSFAEVSVKRVVYKEEHRNLLSLLKKIKYTGTRGLGVLRDEGWHRSTIDELEKVYRELHGKIVATNEVFICKGLKK